MMKVFGAAGWLPLCISSERRLVLMTVHALELQVVAILPASTTYCMPWPNANPVTACTHDVDVGVTRDVDVGVTRRRLGWQLQLGALRERGAHS
jgi:hypothetical protein